MTNECKYELIAELREHERDYPSLIHGPLCGRAADEIERLRVQLAGMRYYINRLEAALLGHVTRDLDEACSAWETDLSASPKVGIIGENLRDALDCVDDQDWDFLLSKLGDGGRERFWKAVIAKLRSCLTLPEGAGGKEE